MNRDEEIRLEVIKELELEPKIGNPTQIEVVVKEGIVTLGGYVNHYMDRVNAKIAAERVSGIQGIVQNIEVEIPAESKQEDLEIARMASSAIDIISILPRGHIKVAVRDGRVTLGGDVEELHQKEEAETIVSKILGVREMTNNIEVIHYVKPTDVKRQILRTFQNMAVYHVRDIHVEINGSKAILTGIVRAWIEKAEAEQAAHEVPGVTEVENRLEVTSLIEGKEKPPVNV